MTRLMKSSYYFPLQVTIDDREPTCIEEELLKLGNMIIHRQRLSTGDYLFDGDLLVERKTIPDLCCSIRDGRLFGQAAKLTRSRTPACIIVEGKNREFKQSGFTTQAMQGVLLSLSLAFKLPVMRAKSPKQSALIMLQGFKQLSRDDLEDKRYYPRKGMSRKKADPLISQKIHILEGFPGIGVDKAERLLAAFGNLQALFTADIVEIQKVPGIGKKTVEELVRVLRS